MKKETRNTIIKWSIYGVLVIATILTFVFSKEIFGYNYHQVLDEYGVWNGNYEWQIEPLFYQYETGNPFTNYILQNAIANTLRTIQIIGETTNVYIFKLFWFSGDIYVNNLFL